MPKRILIVEDDASAAQLLRDFLDRCGYETEWASDGRSGEERARAWRPDLLLLDLMLPRGHGFSVCERLRADPGLAGLKILVISAKAYAADREAAREVGADGYVVKPYELDDLKRRIESLLGA